MSISSYFSYKIDQGKTEWKFVFLASNDKKKPSRFEKHVIESTLGCVLKYLLSN